jgi:hypothetical protein
MAIQKYLGQIGAPGGPTYQGYFYGITVGAGGVTNNGATTYGAVAIGANTTYAPTAAQSGNNFLLSNASGTVVTLPTPSVGLRYTFLVTASVTSNNYKVITNTGTVFLQGPIEEAVAGGTASVYAGNATTNVSVIMNGSTTGGLLGTMLTFTCITPTLWQVSGTNIASGTIATPFSTS